MLQNQDTKSLFDLPPATKLNLLSLGAGVQSSAMAFMAAHGEITPKVDACIFADTMAEPAAVYDWLDYMDEHLPFPILKVTHGDLSEESTRIRTSKKTGNKYLSHNVPVFTKIKGREREGKFRRQCTHKHKISPLNKLCKQLRGFESATVWMGISWDEIDRVRTSDNGRVYYRWPLIEKKITRQDCIDWMENNEYPTPPRSACVYCPYHSNAEWKKIRDEDPISWAQAIAYEKRLQNAVSQIPSLSSVPFLHRSLVPLTDVDLDNVDTTNSSMHEECSGMCGL